MTRSKILIVSLYNRITLRMLLLVISSLLYLSCAAQGPPGGGPVDKTCPVLISSIPGNGSVLVDTKIRVELRFSEAIDPRSTQGSLIVTPRSGDFPNIKVSGRKITVSFVEPLLENTTYVLNFGRSLSDYRGNSASEEARIAFSTGDSIDKGKISGSLFQIPDKAKAEVWVYKKGNSFPDSLLGFEPDYKAVVDEFSSYKVANLSKGEYRLIAVASKSAVSYYITQDDFIGLPQKDPVLLDSILHHVSGINFRIGKPKLKHFRLLGANVSNGYLDLIFSQPVSEFSLQYSVFRWGISGVEVFPCWVDESEPNHIYLKVHGIEDNVNTEVAIEGIYDTFGEIIQPTVRQVKFLWTEKADTVGPYLLRSYPRNGERNVNLNQEIRLDFSEPIISDSIAEKIHLWKEDSVHVTLESEWLDGNSLLLKSAEPLESSTNYSLEVLASFWKDYSDNLSTDSLIMIKFTTVDIDIFGKITGNVHTEDCEDLNRIVVECFLKDDGNNIQKAYPDSLGFYEFHALFPGEYTLSIWEDKNGNSRYDWGSLDPFEMAEPFRTYPDIIRVRSRWETAGVELIY